MKTAYEQGFMDGAKSKQPEIDELTNKLKQYKDTHSGFIALKLPPEYDRRRKLMDKDYEDIKKLYADGFTQGEIARKYNVSKSAIERVLNPNIKLYRQKYMKEHRYLYARSKEENNEIKKERRRYKRDLYEKGLIQK